jgi:hypothetical protein
MAERIEGSEPPGPDGEITEKSIRELHSVPEARFFKESRCDASCLAPKSARNASTFAKRVALSSLLLRVAVASVNG